VGDSLKRPLPISSGIEVQEEPRSVSRRAFWLLGALVTVIVLGYFPVLKELGRDWLRDPNYSHGALIPLISGYLVYRQWGALRSPPARPSSVGLVGVLIGGGLLVVGSAGAEVFTQRVSLVVVLASSVLTLAGWRKLGMVSFPLALLLLAIPLPYVIYYGLTAPMQALAAKVAISGLQLMGVPAASQGNIIHLPETTLEVAQACSGIRSLYSFLTLGALAAYLTPIPIPLRVLVFALAIPLSVAGNAVRVWATGVGAYLIGPEVAEGTVHDAFGLITIFGALAIFWLVRTGVKQLWLSGSPSSS